ncbi:uncharacterized protein LOC106153213 [Lingula anatina]|uniref:Uncharacterized protein LOC106153213 n=1 Tax=Lingula anatina TaxID=7574 RepID=A0A1S3H931_LINAN|nr:uncharacterized protein LOC106153213 [Lingula anatina]|eukprot:XP_013382512.1 uncharacterized protein LOC106153213 [Lingula anatina]
MERKTALKLLIFGVLLKVASSNNTKGYLERHSGFRINSQLVARQLSAVTKLRCIGLCLRAANCSSLAHNEVTQECELSSVPYEDARVSGDLLPSTGWKIYSRVAPKIATTPAPPVQFPGITHYNFTNLGAEGRFGPTTVGSHYDSLPLEGLVEVSSGIQIFTVPYTGTYRVEVGGAMGGGDTYRGADTCYTYNGQGAKMTGTFSFVSGEKLKVLVGQMGLCNTGHAGAGGGGGTFVTTDTDVPLIIAGGGGGSSALLNHKTVSDATDNTWGQDRGTWYGGDNGQGGESSSNTGGAGGGGLLTDGATNANTGATGGSAFVNGGVGGIGNENQPLSNGGFGGGGGAKGKFGGPGGGGGYSGGCRG